MAGNGNDVYNLADGWLELDSDPGLFTLLLQDFGVEGVQVEEIYDLASQPLVPDQSGASGALGFIFLFKWVEERRARLRKLTDEEHMYVKDPHSSVFFAHQLVPNSCATHSLISILLNLDENQWPKVKLGETLNQFKSHVEGMDAETKGLAIGNSPQLAQAHNSHAVPRARRRQERPSAGTPAMPASSTRNSAETFHFVSYVPINGRLYELDGLKRYPIDHGPIPEGSDWTETFRGVIKERLGMANSGGAEPYHDIRFALMAVVPDKRSAVLDRLLMLRSNRNIVIQALKQLVGQSLDSRKKDYDDEDIDKLEKDVQRVLIRRKRAESRASSIDSLGSNPPGSPFQSNPLLVSHDYSKSPMMESIDEEVEIEKEDIKIDPVKDFDPKFAKLYEPQNFTPTDLLSLLRSIETDIAECDTMLKDENDKHRRHTVDDCRRVHDYDEFICTFLSMLAEQGHLGDLLEHGLNVRKKPASSTTNLNSSATSNGNTSASDKVKSKSSKSVSKKPMLKEKSKSRTTKRRR